MSILPGEGGVGSGEWGEENLSLPHSPFHTPPSTDWPNEEIWRGRGDFCGIASGRALESA